MIQPDLERLEVADFRCHSEVRLAELRAPWVVISGHNGSGKTSLLEAIYSAARGRSFRTRISTDLIRAGADEARIFLETGGGAAHRLGVAFRRNANEVRLDGSAAPGMARVAAAIPVDYLGADGFRLIDGTPGARRRFLDWGLFHVEPAFLPAWQAWLKAHRHRNDLLRRGDFGDVEPWTRTVSLHGESLSTFRARFVKQLAEGLLSLPREIQALAGAKLAFRPGWHEETLAQSLGASSRRERQAGRAVVGPQHDDWEVVLRDGPAGRLSRGQAKLACLLLVRVRAALIQRAGRHSLLLVDDLMADLDPASVAQALQVLAGTAGQTWLSVLEEHAQVGLPQAAQRFHVEPGKIRPL